VSGRKLCLRRSRWRYPSRTALALRRFLVLALLLAGTAQAANSDALFAAKLDSSDGKVVALETWRGKPLIVNFWARWCAPCRVEIPELVKTQDKYRKRGLVVIGIGLEDKAESVRDFMKAYEMSYTVLLARDGRHRTDEGPGQHARRTALHRGHRSSWRDRRDQAGRDESQPSSMPPAKRP
jgi:thiol-disulfide isomerase/thioredoxin